MPQYVVYRMPYKDDAIVIIASAYPGLTMGESKSWKKKVLTFAAAVFNAKMHKLDLLKSEVQSFHQID